MSAPLQRGQVVSFVEDGRERSGSVTATWANGKRAVVTTPDGQVFTIRAEQTGVSRPAIFVRVDLDKAESVAHSILDGDQQHGSVTEQMLILAAAVVHLRRGLAA